MASISSAVTATRQNRGAATTTATATASPATSSAPSPAPQTQTDSTAAAAASPSVSGRNRKSPSFLKLAVLGEKQVGKTSLVTRYTQGSFNPTYLHTKGGDISESEMQMQGRSLRLSIIDSAGHKYVRSLIKSLYRDVHGILLVYDVTRKSTFEALDEWINQINLVNTSSPLIMIVGNKSDLVAYRQVETEEAGMYAWRNGFAHVESSAKTGTNVGAAFLTLVRETVSQKLTRTVPEDNIKLKNSESGEKGSCCR